MDYAMPSYRKSKRDKRAKGRYAPYKKGGKHRSDNIVLSSNKTPVKENK